MDDHERAASVLAEARENAERLRDFKIEQRDDLEPHKEWTLPEPEPPKVERPLDTTERQGSEPMEALLERVHILTIVGEWVGPLFRRAANVNSKHRQDLGDELSKLQAELRRQELETVKLEARLCGRIADLAKLIAAPASARDDTSPSLGRSSVPPLYRRVN